MLQTLVNISTPEEIKVYDKIIGEEKEFAYYAGVVSRLGLAAQQAAQGSPPKAFDAKFKKQSLAWLLALARVELGATMSMYGRSRTPFADIGPPGNYGSEEYMAVVADDLAAHLQALSTDVELKRICRMTAQTGSNTLAYLRRLKVVNDMLRLIQAVGDSQYSEMASQVERELDEYKRALVVKIMMAETTQTNVSENTHTGTYESIQYKRAGRQSCKDVAASIMNSNR